MRNSNKMATSPYILSKKMESRSLWRSHFKTLPKKKPKAKGMKTKTLARPRMPTT